MRAYAQAVELYDTEHARARASQRCNDKNSTQKAKNEPQNRFAIPNAWPVSHSFKIGFFRNYIIRKSFEQGSTQGVASTSIQFLHCKRKASRPIFASTWSFFTVLAGRRADCRKYQLLIYCLNGQLRCIFV